MPGPKYEGLVVLDSVEAESVETNLLYMYLFTAKSILIIKPMHNMYVPVLVAMSFPATNAIQESDT